jgi:hypothetical protein
LGGLANVRGRGLDGKAVAVRPRRKSEACDKLATEAIVMEVSNNYFHPQRYLWFVACTLI